MSFSDTTVAIWQPTTYLYPVQPVWDFCQKETKMVLRSGLIFGSFAQLSFRTFEVNYLTTKNFFVMQATGESRMAKLS